MKIYFTGLNVEFIESLRELIAIQKKTDEVLLLPNKYVDNNKLMYYDEAEQKLVEIENIKEHSF